MQQNEKYLRNFIQSFYNGDLSSCYMKQQTKKQKNIIEKINIIQEGINYIVPAFWYQELIQLNSNKASINQIEIPSFQQCIKILQLYELKNPQLSSFSIKQLLSKQSQLLKTNLLSESNYVKSKTFKFCKFSQFISQNEISWKVINPYLYSLIQNKLQIQLLNESSNCKMQQRFISNQIQNSFQFSQNSNQQENIPQIAVFLKRQFILQKAFKQKSTSEPFLQDDSIQININGKRKNISQQNMQSEIFRQLKNMTQTSINLILIVDKNLKIEIQGYLSKDISFKDFIKNLIKIQSLKKKVDLQKFYLYDDHGQRNSTKQSTIGYLSQVFENKVFFVTTTSLKQIYDNQAAIKHKLDDLLQTQFNFPQNYLRFQENHIELYKSIQKININLVQYKTNNQILKINGFIQMQYFNSLKEKTTKKNNIIIQSSVGGNNNFSKKYEHKIEEYQSEELRRINNESQNSEARNIDSVTTNFDTPFFCTQSRSQNFGSQNSYRNERLHNHSEANKMQRRKKSQRFLMKRRKVQRNKILTKDKDLSNVSKNYHSDNKKRFEYKIFHSLCNLDGQSQILQYLINNMRKVSLEAIFQDQDQMILHPYKKIFQQTQIESQNSNFEQKSKNSKQKQKSRQHKINIEQQALQKQLDKIASVIEHKYEPQIQDQKDTQKYLEKMGLSKVQFLQDYEQYLLLASIKKDCEQIKTIIDNSQPTYTQIQKPTYNPSKHKKFDKKHFNIRTNNNYNSNSVSLSFEFDNQRNEKRQKGYLSDGNGQEQFVNEEQTS